MTTTKKKMTRQEAIAKLTETRKLSTGMLKPLGFSFESFLKFAQVPKVVQEGVISDLITLYTSSDPDEVRKVREKL